MFELCRILLSAWLFHDLRIFNPKKKVGVLYLSTVLSVGYALSTKKHSDSQRFKMIVSLLIEEYQPVYRVELWLTIS